MYVASLSPFILHIRRLYPTNMQIFGSRWQTLNVHMHMKSMPHIQCNPPYTLTGIGLTKVHSPMSRHCANRKNKGDNSTQTITDSTSEQNLCSSTGRGKNDTIWKVKSALEIVAVLRENVRFVCGFSICWRKSVWLRIACVDDEMRGKKMTTKALTFQMVCLLIDEKRAISKWLSSAKDSALAAAEEEEYRGVISFVPLVLSNENRKDRLFLTSGVRDWSVEH